MARHREPDPEQRTHRQVAANDGGSPDRLIAEWPVRDPSSKAKQVAFCQLVSVKSKTRLMPPRNRTFVRRGGAIGQRRQRSCYTERK